jgi:hypothetical protein
VRTRLRPGRMQPRLQASRSESSHTHRCAWPRPGGSSAHHPGPPRPCQPPQQLLRLFVTPAPLHFCRRRGRHCLPKGQFSSSARPPLCQAPRLRHASVSPPVHTQAESQRGPSSTLAGTPPSSARWHELQGRVGACVGALTLRPMRNMACLNSSLSSARSMEGSLAPMSSTPYLSSRPLCVVSATQTTTISKGERGARRGVAPAGRPWRAGGRALTAGGLPAPASQAGAGKGAARPPSPPAHFQGYAAVWRMGAPEIPPTAPLRDSWPGSGRSGRPWWAGSRRAAPAGGAGRAAGAARALGVVAAAAAWPWGLTLRSAERGGPPCRRLLLYHSLFAAAGGTQQAPHHARAPGLRLSAPPAKSARFRAGPTQHMPCSPDTTRPRPAAA